MINFETPLDAFLYWERQIPNKLFLKQPVNGGYVTYTYAEAGVEVRKIAHAITSHKLPKHSHVALLSKNCAHWILADLAIMISGFVSIPIYPTLNSVSINQILIHSESKLIIVGKLDDYENQKEGITEIPRISVALYGQSDGQLWEDIIKDTNSIDYDYKQLANDLHTIIYTSGTTGVPKGVMHSSGNLMVSARTLTKLFNLPPNLKLFSYLPLAHVAERVMINAGVVLGGTISFTESLETFSKDLEQTQPHLFFAVPRIWTKFREKILESIPQKKLNLLLAIPILKDIVKNKLKQKLGLKEAMFVVSAAAPISASLISWYRKIGITIFQGYGMTEDCCVSHFNTNEHDKIGTVGKTLYNVQVKLSAEGEICVKNNCLMKGYFKEPEITASVFDQEGYLKTGDIGEFDHDGFLTITGRVKDQFKTDKGKYISPSHIELMMSKNTNIEQICIVGTGIPQPIALITLSVSGDTKDKEVLISSLEDSIKLVNRGLEKHEKIEKVVVMKEDWNVANGLTTPTMKVKRTHIEKIHKAYYKSWFDMNESVIFE